MLHTIALAELVVCWIAWWLAFAKPSRQSAGQTKVVRAPGSKWGIILEAVGFAFLWTHLRPAGFEKAAPALIASIVLAPFSTALGWAATRHLGKQWRLEAALIEGHELIQSGPYRWVRHPIYASMLGMALATGFAWTWWPTFLAGIIIFLIGTEIRVRAEDRLLSDRFGAAFRAYRARVPAYIPFVR